MYCCYFKYKKRLTAVNIVFICFIFTNFHPLKSNITKRYSYRTKLNLFLICDNTQNSVFDGMRTEAVKIYPAFERDKILRNSFTFITLNRNKQINIKANCNNIGILYSFEIQTPEKTIEVKIRHEATERIFHFSCNRSKTIKI